MKWMLKIFEWVRTGGLSYRLFKASKCVYVKVPHEKKVDHP